MPNYQHLNNVTHQDIKVITKHNAELGDCVASSLTFPTEYGNVHKEYPIFFRKDPETGEFYSIAVFGFENGENLFIQNQQWHANYIPAAIKKGPFLIGYSNNDEAQSAVISIDMNSPRVNKTQGQAIFLADGQISPYTEDINSLLLSIHQGIEYSKAMFAAFNEYELIEAVTLTIKLDNGKEVQLQDNYTIQEEKLNQLDGQSLEKLNKTGFLQAAFLVADSINNIKTLIAKKNAQLAQ